MSAQVHDNITPALYYLLNFNDFGASLVTLFHIMVVNNWFITCNMYCYVMGNNWPRLYFISFWALTVLIMLNLVIAFIIEIYDTVSQEIEFEYKRGEFVLKLQKKFLNIEQDESTVVRSQSYQRNESRFEDIPELPENESEDRSADDIALEYRKTHLTETA